MRANRSSKGGAATTWFSTPVHPVFERTGADKFLELPILPEEQCWIDFCGGVYIANIFCGTLFEVDGSMYISSPSGGEVVHLGRASLFDNEPERGGVMGKTALFQRVCDLCGFNIGIFVADHLDSAFNQLHNLTPGRVKYLSKNTE